MLTVALCKGKLIEPTLELFTRAGYGAAKLATNSRRLMFPCPEIGMTFLIVRPTDVPTYVEYGAADVGIVGKERCALGTRQRRLRAIGFRVRSV